MLGQPGEQRTPDATVGRQFTASATTLKPQLSPEPLWTLINFRRRRSSKHAHRFSDTHDLGVGPQRQIENRAAAVTQTSD